MNCKLFRNKKPYVIISLMASQVKRHERRHNVEDDPDCTDSDVFVAEPCIV